MDKWLNKKSTTQSSAEIEEMPQISYKISLRSAQTGKPYTIGESFILLAIRDAVVIDSDILEIEKVIAFKQHSLT